MRHKSNVTEGIRFPADGGKPEVGAPRFIRRSGTSLHSSVLGRFTLPFVLLTLPKGLPILYWTERLIFFHQDGFQWFDVLNYDIAYYSAHQNSPPDT